jgi:carboxyl-terminal processing protease
VAFDKVTPLNFRKYDSAYGVNPTTIAKLKEQSAQRIDTSNDFGKLKKNIVRYEEQKAKKEVPLNDKKFTARREEFDAEKEEEKTFDEHAQGTTEVFKRDFYNNEVLAITLDYLRELGKEKVANARTTAVPN